MESDAGHVTVLGSLGIAWPDVKFARISGARAIPRDGRGSAWACHPGALGSLRHCLAGCQICTSYRSEGDTPRWARLCVGLSSRGCFSTFTYYFTHIVPSRRYLPNEIGSDARTIKLLPHRAHLKHYKRGCESFVCSSTTQSTPSGGGGGGGNGDASALHQQMSPSYNESFYSAST